jgi:hypothetical protein
MRKYITVPLIVVILIIGLIVLYTPPMKYDTTSSVEKSP